MALSLGGPAGHPSSSGLPRKKGRADVCRMGWIWEKLGVWAFLGPPYVDLGVTVVGMRETDKCLWVIDWDMALSVR